MSKGLKSYRYGRSLEYRLMRMLREKDNCVCVRSAGSHTPIDIIAGNGNQVWGIQVKGGKRPYISRKDLEELAEWCNKLKIQPLVAVYRKGKRWEFYTVAGYMLTHADELDIRGGM